MTEITYKKIFEFLEEKRLVTFVVALLKFSTLFIYVTYPLFLLGLYVIKSNRLAVLILVPFISFILVTVFRNIKNAKRPYEVYGFKPLLNKDSLGKSFPSRHTFSAFVIATSILSINLPIGATLLLLGVIIAISRVVLGLHFIKDVVFGAVFGIVSGVVCFII